VDFFAARKKEAANVSFPAMHTPTENGKDSGWPPKQARQFEDLRGPPPVER